MAQCDPGIYPQNYGGWSPYWHVSTTATTPGNVGITPHIIPSYGYEWEPMAPHEDGSVVRFNPKPLTNDQLHDRAVDDWTDKHIAHCVWGTIAFVAYGFAMWGLNVLCQ